MVRATLGSLRGCPKKGYLLFSHDLLQKKNGEKISKISPDDGKGYYENPIDRSPNNGWWYGWSTIYRIKTYKVFIYDISEAH